MDARGIPVSVSVFEGNTGDSKTLLPQVTKLRKHFGLEQFEKVCQRIDRGRLHGKDQIGVRVGKVVNK